MPSGPSHPHSDPAGPHGSDQRPSTSYLPSSTGLNLASTSHVFDTPSTPFSRISSRSPSPSGSGPGSRPRSALNGSEAGADESAEPITAFIPQRLTVDAYPGSRDDDDDEKEEYEEEEEREKDGGMTDAPESVAWRQRSILLNRTRHLWKSSKKRKTALKVLKTGEGRDNLLQLMHSLVLLLHSSLHFPPPRTHLESILAPGRFLLTRLFPRSFRAESLQRIYTAAEGLANVRRIVLLARWIQAGTEAAMDRMRAKQLPPASQRAKLSPPRTSLPTATDEAQDDGVTLLDAKEEGFRWLQPQSLVPFDSGTLDDEAAKERGTRMSGAEVEQLASISSRRETWERRLALVGDTLATLGEACDVAAFLAGSGIFWRTVGFNELGILGYRRRKGVERVGVVLSLCSVLVSLVFLRMQRLRLRAELRSAHRRIIRANDRIGWASELSGRTIPTGLAISDKDGGRGRRRPRAIRVGSEVAEREASSAAAPTGSTPATEADAEAGASTEPDVPHTTDTLRRYGPGIQEALEDLDDASSPRSTSSPTAPSPRHARSPSADHHTLRPSSLLRSTERNLLRAETDLAHVRHSLVWAFWERIAVLADGVFLAFEALRPDTDKEGVEAVSGILAGGIRLLRVWNEVK